MDVGSDPLTRDKVVSRAEMGTLARHYGPIQPVEEDERRRFRLPDGTVRDHRATKPILRLATAAGDGGRALVPVPLRRARIDLRGPLRAGASPRGWEILTDSWTSRADRGAGRLALGQDAAGAVDGPAGDPHLKSRGEADAGLARTTAPSPLASLTDPRSILRGSRSAPGAG
jgi:hypothetical protein